MGIIGNKKGTQIEQSCTISERSDVKPSTKAIWSTEQELGNCTKAVFDISKPLKLRFLTSAEDYSYCPKSVEVKIEEYFYCAYRRDRKNYSNDDNKKDHPASKGKCS